MDAYLQFVIQGGALAILGYYFLRVQPKMIQEWTQATRDYAVALVKVQEAVDRLDDRWSCSKADCGMRTPLIIRADK